MVDEAALDRFPVDAIAVALGCRKRPDVELLHLFGPAGKLTLRGGLASRRFHGPVVFGPKMLFQPMALRAPHRHGHQSDHDQRRDRGCCDPDVLRIDVVHVRSFGFESRKGCAVLASGRRRAASGRRGRPDEIVSRRAGLLMGRSHDRPRKLPRPRSPSPARRSPAKY
jgi:hypothetical protein